MSKEKKIALLVAPIIVFVVSILAVCTMLSPVSQKIIEFQGLYSALGIICFMMGIFNLIFMVVYIIHVIQNEKLDKRKKVIWGILIYSFNVAVMPFYWYFYIRSE